MISKLLIRNFQSHKKTSIKLSPGVNVIIGSSDNGKSSILRAIKWVLQNKPNGDAFRSWWGGNTRVSIKSGNSIVRREKGDENRYLVKGVETIEYKSMGQGVPEEVEEFLNMGSINIQEQHETHFLLSSSSGEVARTLNKIVSLETIDSSLFKINKEVRDCSNGLTYAESELSEQEAVLEEYAWLPEAGKKIKGLLASDKRIGVLLSDTEDLKHLIEITKIVSENLKKWDRVLTKEKEVVLMLSLELEKTDLVLAARGLKTLAQEIHETEKSLTKLNNTKKMEHLCLATEQCYEDLSSLLLRYNILEGCVGEMRENEKESGELKKEISLLEKEFHKEMGTICPLCEQQIERR